MEESFNSEDPHYFIVLNKTPTGDAFLVLVNATSQIEKIEKRWKSLPHTIVKITKVEYPAFTKDESIIDCNSVTKHSIDEIVEMLQSGRLKHKPEIQISVVEKLREAVLASPVVENNVKDILR